MISLTSFRVWLTSTRIGRAEGILSRTYKDLKKAVAVIKMHKKVLKRVTYQIKTTAVYPEVRLFLSL